MPGAGLTGDDEFIAELTLVADELEQLADGYDDEDEDDKQP